MADPASPPPPSRSKNDPALVEATTPSEERSVRKQLSRGGLPFAPVVTFASTTAKNAANLVPLTDQALRQALGSTRELQPEDPVLKVLNEKYLNRVRTSKFAPRLKHLRRDAIDYARNQKETGIWDAEIHGEVLQEIIRTSQIREKEYARKSARMLEPPELTKMLREDPHQHTCEVRLCSKMIVGWACVFLFCHVPWIIAMFLVALNYQPPDVHEPFDDMDSTSPPLDPDIQASCLDARRYLFGFFVIYATNIVIGLMVAIARYVDESKNLCVRITPWVTSIISITILGYSIYGIIVVWDFNLWSELQSPACQSIRALAVAVLSFFFLLPIVCFGILQLFGARKDDQGEGADPNTPAAVLGGALGQQSTSASSPTEPGMVTAKTADVAELSKV